MTTDGAVVFAAGRMVYARDPGRLRALALRRKAQGLHGAGHRTAGAHLLRLAGSPRLRARARRPSRVERRPRRRRRRRARHRRPRRRLRRAPTATRSSASIPTTGDVVWRANVGGYVRGTLSVARNGDVLAGVYGPRPARRPPATGRRRPSAATSRSKGPARATSASTAARSKTLPGTLVFGAQDDAVYAVDASGKLLWRFVAGGDVDAPATLLTMGRSSSAPMTARFEPFAPRDEPAAHGPLRPCCG